MKMSKVFDLPIGIDEPIFEDYEENEVNSAIIQAVNSHDKLVETLNELLNDCINFSDDSWSDLNMKKASDLLKEIRNGD